MALLFLLQVLQNREPGGWRQDPPLEKTNPKGSKGRNTKKHHTLVSIPLDGGVVSFYTF